VRNIALTVPVTPMIAIRRTSSFLVMFGIFIS
jgi:hypothetical protein